MVSLSVVLLVPPSAAAWGSWSDQWIYNFIYDNLTLRCVKYPRHEKKYIAGKSSFVAQKWYSGHLEVEFYYIHQFQAVIDWSQPLKMVYQWWQKIKISQQGSQ